MVYLVGFVNLPEAVKHRKDMWYLTFNRNWYAVFGIVCCLLIVFIVSIKLLKIKPARKLIELECNSCRIPYLGYGDINNVNLKCGASAVFADVTNKSVSKHSNFVLTKR